MYRKKCSNFNEYSSRYGFIYLGLILLISGCATIRSDTLTDRNIKNPVNKYGVGGYRVLPREDRIELFLLNKKRIVTGKLIIRTKHMESEERVRTLYTLILKDKAIELLIIPEELLIQLREGGEGEAKKATVIFNLDKKEFVQITKNAFKTFDSHSVELNLIAEVWRQYIDDSRLPRRGDKTIKKNPVLKSMNMKRMANADLIVGTVGCYDYLGCSAEYSSCIDCDQDNSIPSDTYPGGPAGVPCCLADEVWAWSLGPGEDWTRMNVKAFLDYECIEASDGNCAKCCRYWSLDCWQIPSTPIYFCTGRASPCPGLYGCGSGTRPTRPGYFGSFEALK